MHLFAVPTTIAVFFMIIICGFLIFEALGVECFNCIYKEKDRYSHQCLYPANQTTVNCSRDGVVKTSTGTTKDLNDKCSVVNGTHDEFGTVIIRTCSRGETVCKLLKERNQYFTVGGNRKAKLFFVSATHCNCDGDYCNDRTPPNGTLPFKPLVGKKASKFKLNFNNLKDISISKTVAIDVPFHLKLFMHGAILLRLYYIIPFLL